MPYVVLVLRQMFVDYDGRFDANDRGAVLRRWLVHTVVLQMSGNDQEYAESRSYSNGYPRGRDRGGLVGGEFVLRPRAGSETNHGKCCRQA